MTEQLNNYLYSPRGSPKWDRLAVVSAVSRCFPGAPSSVTWPSGQPGISWLGAGLTREHSRMAVGRSKVTWPKLEKGSSTLLVGRSWKPCTLGTQLLDGPTPSSPLWPNTHVAP